MTAINPDFSATAACITAIALSATSPERQKCTQYFFCGILMLLIAILPITPDATTIRDMEAELLPLVSLGYVTMPMGIVCWTIVGI